MNGRQPHVITMTTMPTASAVTPHSTAQTLTTVMQEANLPPRKEARDPAELKRLARRRWMIASSVMAMAITLVAGLGSLVGGSGQNDQSLVYFTVQKRDLPITVTERGTLQSQKNVEVICEVDDVHGDGVDGTPILWIVENGSYVKEGDLIVELDSSSHQERLDQQILSTQQARAKFLQAEAQYENRLSRNDTALANAELKVQTTGLDLKQYEDEQGGMFQIELQEIELAIQQRSAQESIYDRNLEGTQDLYDLGYKSKGDLAQARLQALRAEAAREREEARRKELVQYTYKRNKLELEGALQLAERALLQVRGDNQAQEAEARAWLDSAKQSLEREEKRLERYQEQLVKCKIYAPQSGMVAYYVESHRWGQSSTIAAGTPVRERQQILSIPSLQLMQVETAVHESVVDRVKVGMPVTIRLDAFSDRSYDGTLDSVAVLPDPGGWLSSDTKVYKTIVKIDEEVDQIKPGMTAVVEIHVENLEDVLCVPVQAIVQEGKETWCYVAQAGQIRKRPLQLGKTNDKFVEIRSGLTEGDQVVLNAASLLAETRSAQPGQAAEGKKEG